MLDFDFKLGEISTEKMLNAVRYKFFFFLFKFFNNFACPVSRSKFLINIQKNSCT